MIPSWAGLCKGWIEKTGKVWYTDLQGGKTVENIWLEHYYHADCEPLKNIMRLPREAAFAMAKQLADAHPETTAFYRFADFENYYPLRLETDNMLYERFCALGGKPREKHPLSFVLGSSDYLHRWFGEGNVIRIPLTWIDPEIVSFTLGDSMSTRSRLGDVTLLTLPMLQQAMQAHPQGTDGYLQDVFAQHTYIEVQVRGDVSFPGKEVPHA